MLRLSKEGKDEKEQEAVCSTWIHNVRSLLSNSTRTLRMVKTIAFLSALCALGVCAPSALAQHSATLKWTQPTQPSGLVVSNVTVQKNGVTVTTIPVTTLSYIDLSVSANQAYSYVVTNNFTNGAFASVSASATIPPDVPPPPQCPTCPVMGQRIKVISVANIRATAVASTNPSQWGAILDTEPANALGTVVSTPSPANGTFFWIQVKFDTCVATIPNCTGWMGSDNMTIVTTPPPVQSMTTVCSWISSTIWRCNSTVQNVPSGQAIKSITTTGTITNTTNGVKP